MDELKKINDQELEEVVGGFQNQDGSWRIVAGLQTGWLAMRTAPTYDYSNEMRGNELYNGDRVQVLSGTTSECEGVCHAFCNSPGQVF